MSEAQLGNWIGDHFTFLDASTGDDLTADRQRSLGKYVTLGENGSSPFATSQHSCLSPQLNPPRDC